MQEHEQIQYETERDVGEKARHAWEGFFKPFFEEKSEVLIEAFRICEMRDEEGLIKIHMQFKAIDALRAELLGYIETGKLASVSLDQAEAEASNEEETNDE